MRLSLILTVATLALAGCPGPTPTEPTGDINDRDADGFTAAQDCNDNDPAINPDATDEVGDDIDNNCDGIDGVDEDRDDFASEASGGDDCDDADNAINPDAVDVGWNGIDEDCVGGDRHDFTELGVGHFVSCGTRTDGGFMCWGLDDKGQVSDAPTTPVTGVSGALGYLCGIQNGAVVCWGEDRNVEDFPDDPTVHVVANAPEGTNFTQVSVADTHACAITNLGAPVCWGDDTNPIFENIPVREFNDIHVGDLHACGVIDIGGPINYACWGNDILLEGDVIPQGPYRQLASGAGHMCGVLQDSTLRCWGGTNTHGQRSPANRKGPYTDLSVHTNHGCGILSASRIECWGRNNFGQILPPENRTAIDVETGFAHTCALNGQGIAFCWGDNSENQLDIP